MVLCGKVLFFFLLWKNAASMLGSYDGMNLLCIAEHCGSQTIACMENADCRQNFECIIGCGTHNTTCIFVCLSSYKNAIYDATMKCIVNDHHCLTMDPPDPGFRCNPPKAFVKNFSLSQLQGTWYLVRGLNKDYDCFNCHIARFTPSEVTRNYTLLDKFDVPMVNGSIRHSVYTQQMEQKDPSNGGILDNTNSMMGTTSYEKWHVLYYPAGGRYVIFYWCGHVSSDWWYEGSFVYSRSPVISPTDLATVANMLEATTGHAIDQYCVPNTTNC